MAAVRVVLDKSHLFFAAQLTGRALATAVAEDVKHLQGQPCETICPLCGAAHLDKGYGRACRRCWLTHA